MEYVRAAGVHIVHSDRRAADAEVERWFEALDGQEVDSGLSRWIIEVVGIHVDGPDLWVQLAPRGSAANTLVLRVASGMAPDAARSLILQHGAQWPAGGFRVVDLRQTRPAA